MSWAQVPFDSIIADSAFGPRFSGDCYAVDGNVATLRTTDLSIDGVISLSTMPEATIAEEKFADHFLQVGDLVISRSGRIGTTAVFNGYHKPVLPGAFLIRFRLDKEKANPLFYRYFFNSAVGQQRLLSVARGAAQQNINITNVRTLPVPLPSLKVQELIASRLSEFDNLIENNRRRIALLEQSARLLYREWFVHLRFPGHEHVKVVDGVPEGWRKERLTDLAEITMGQSPTSDHYNKDRIGFPFHQGVTGFGVRFVEHETWCDVRGRMAMPMDILFSVRAPVGRLNVTPDEIVIGRGLAALRSKHNLQSMLFYQLANHFFKEDMIGGGAIFASVTKKELEGQLMLMPSLNLAYEFNEMASSIDRQIGVLVEQNKKLREARDLLLPRLMSGDLVV